MSNYNARKTKMVDTKDLQVGDVINCDDTLLTGPSVHGNWTVVHRISEKLFVVVQGDKSLTWGGGVISLWRVVSGPSTSRVRTMFEVRIDTDERGPTKVIGYSDNEQEALEWGKGKGWYGSNGFTNPVQVETDGTYLRLVQK